MIRPLHISQSENPNKSPPTGHLYSYYRTTDCTPHAVLYIP